MKKLALLTSVVLSSTSILSAGELENLRTANAEQKRQINNLEKEIDKLYSLLDREMRENGKKPQSRTVNYASSKTTFTYTVVKGDTLSKISRTHGISLSKLMSYNGLNSRSVLRIGQKLSIPNGTKIVKQSEASKLPALPKIPNKSVVKSTPVTTSGTYKVIKGDTFYAISRKLNVSVAALNAANPNVNPSSLKIGQRVNIPTGGKKAVASTPAKKPAQTVAKKPAAPKSVAKKPAIPQPTIVKKETKKVDTVSFTPVQEMKPISLQSQMTMQELAEKNGTTVDALNALNGWNFRSSVKLARGSEVFLPN